mgnify:CR=1 FL=1
MAGFRIDLMYGETACPPLSNGRDSLNQPPIADRLRDNQSNAWPAIVDNLAHRLGVTAQSLIRLGVGWSIDDDCWVFPERDGDGSVVGLVRRYKDGAKLCQKGSKRGLTYAVNPGYVQGREYKPGRENWSRTSETYPCPVCSKTDGCLVSAENPEDPKAAICIRPVGKTGAQSYIEGSGWLHIRKSAGNVRLARCGLIGDSEYPVLILEGQSDVACAMDLGFEAIGRPSAMHGGTTLLDLLRNRDVVIIGENDRKPNGDWPGKDGAIKAFETLRAGSVKSVKYIFPPEEFKDLREWKNKGELTDAGLLAAISQGVDTSDS